MRYTFNDLTGSYIFVIMDSMRSHKITDTELQDLKELLESINVSGWKLWIRRDDKTHLALCARHTTFKADFSQLLCRTSIDNIYDMDMIASKRVLKLAEYVYDLVIQGIMHELHEHFTIDLLRAMNPHFTGLTKL